MSDYGIRVLADGMSIPEGEWLTAYDPDGGDERVSYPTGHFETNPDPTHALRFPDQVAAWELWKTQSSRTPLRPDGKPNRPLTAVMITVEKLP